MRKGKNYMQMNTHPILPVLKDFIKIPCKELALLINGPWGSGKTFFLKHLFKDEWEGKKTIYISLKGVVSLEDIARKVSLQIIMCKLPEKGFISKFLSKISSLNPLKNMDLPYFNVSGFAQSLEEVIIARADLSKYIFVFDDLERLPSHITYKEALFYIHNLLLENHAANVIVVTDKEHLFDDKNKDAVEEYREVASKVFYREVPFSQNIRDIFTNYLEIRYPDFSDSLSKMLLASKAIEEIFEVNKTSNLRYYNQMFDALYVIGSHFDCIDFPSDEIKQNILNELLLWLWYEYIFLQLNASIPEEERFYPFSGFSILSHEYKFIHQFCVEGQLNVQKMQQEISERLIYYTQRLPIKEDLDCLNHFSEYSSSEICRARDHIMEIGEKLNDIDLLIDIYSCFIFLDEVGLINRGKYLCFLTKLENHIRKLVFSLPKLAPFPIDKMRHKLYAANQKLISFLKGLDAEYQKRLENTFIDCFLSGDFSNSALLQYCEFCTLQRTEELWKQLFLNREKLVQQGKLTDFVQFMAKNLRKVKISENEAENFIEIYLSQAQNPAEVEYLRHWILKFVAAWGTSDYKKYAVKLRKHNQNLIREWDK